MPRDLAIQSDGKIVVVGQGDGQGQQRDFAIVRYNPDGSLDDGGPNDGTPGNAFGGGGVVYTDFFAGPISTFDAAFAVGIDDQGRIVVAGQGGLGQDVAVARYLSDGTLDTSFDEDGRTTVSLGFGTDIGLSLGFHPTSDDVFVSASSATSMGDFAQSVFSL